MSPLTVQAMERLWSLYVLMTLFPVNAAHGDSSGLHCTNDFINNVSCTWDGSWAGSGEDCWISGKKNVFNRMTANRETITQSCELKKHGNSLPGCSFAFKGKMFFSPEVMPMISIRCGDKWMENLTDYKPNDHIKMHPPGTPDVSISDNGTLISWTPGSPLSEWLKSKIEFQVQVKQSNQFWTEARDISTQEQELMISPGKLKGNLQVRVRVMPINRPNSHWSDWSPTTSWVEADKESFQVQISLIVTGVVLLLGLNVVLILTFYKICKSCALLKGKPLPNPSKYFQTVQSVHEGNLKKWLNPLSLPESFFTVQPCEQISPVEVCEDWDAVPSPSQSSSSTSALLHFQSYPSSGSDTSGVAYNSSSMSTYSNMGYFMSSSYSGSAQTDPSPAYFTYEDDFQNLSKSHNLPLSPCLPLNSCPSYESLKRKPESPDSGLDMKIEDEKNESTAMDKEEEQEEEQEEEKDVLNDQSPPILILPVHLPSRICPSSCAPAPPQPPTVMQISSDNLQVDVDETAASDSSASCLVVGAVCRSSSMPVEPGKTGYMTLKELQSTFSNKSI